MSRPRRTPPIQPMPSDRRAPHGAGFVWVALTALVGLLIFAALSFGRPDAILWGAASAAAAGSIADTVSRFW